MDDVETTLRETLTERAASAPDGRQLPERVHRIGTRRRTVRWVVGSVAAVAVVAAVGIAVQPLVTPLRSADDIVTTEPDPTDEPEIACGPGATPFDPDLLVERPFIDPVAELGIPVRTTAYPHIAQRLIEGWTLLNQTDTTADFLIWLKPSDEVANTFGTQLTAASYELIDGTWQFRGSGGCDPQLVFHDGLNAAEWTLAGDPPGPEATAVTILVSEYSCHDGTTAQRLTPPKVEYRDDAVVITTRVEPPEGEFFTCIGWPPTEVTVELDEPLGDRRLLDGMWWPARDVTQIPPF